MAQGKDVRYHVPMEIVADDGFGPSWSGAGETMGGAELSSPFIQPLGEPYLFDGPGAPVGVYGMCPLCNNAQHGKLDGLLVRGEIGAVVGMGFTRREIALHMVRHIGPAYRDALLPLLEASGDLPEGFLEEKFPDVVKALKRMEASNARYERVREEGIDAVPDGHYLPREIPGGGPGADDPASEGGGPGPLPCHDELLHDPRIGRDYAMDGGRGLRPLAPWTRTRSVAEMAIRQVEAINFYDEMMAIRGRAIDVYDRIMGEKRPDGTYEGGLVDPRVVEVRKDNGDTVETVVGGDPKLMSIAVAAVREMSGVVDTLCKMSLIAKKIGEDGPGEELDPAIKSIVDSIGARKAITVDVEAVAAEAEGLARDTAERAADAGQLPMRKVEEEGDA